MPEAIDATPDTPTPTRQQTAGTRAAPATARRLEPGNADDGPAGDAPPPAPDAAGRREGVRA